MWLGIVTLQFIFVKIFFKAKRIYLKLFLKNGKNHLKITNIESTFLRTLHMF